MKGHRNVGERWDDSEEILGVRFVLGGLDLGWFVSPSGSERLLAAECVDEHRGQASRVVSLTVPSPKVS